MLEALKAKLEEVKLAQEEAWKVYQNTERAAKEVMKSTVDPVEKKWSELYQLTGALEKLIAHEQANLVAASAPTTTVTA